MPGLILTLDTAPPANPTLRLNDGEAVTGDRSALAYITVDESVDDVSEMMIWGDVDPTGDPDIQPDEGDSSWVAFAGVTPLLLSDTSERKRIYARLRDDVGNETLAFSDYIDLDLDRPVLSITVGFDVEKVSKKAGFDEASFTWEPNVDLSEWEVRVVPYIYSDHTAGVILEDVAGSTNISGGVALADVPVTTIIKGTDLEIASPGNSPKIVKIFGKSQSTSAWSV